MGKKIYIPIISLLLHIFYIVLYFNSAAFFEVDRFYFSEVIIMLLPSVFSIISLLLLIISKGATLSRILCIIAWCAIGFCYIDLNAGIYGGKLYVGPFNYAPSDSETRRFKMFLLCICVFALLLNYVAAKRKICRIKTYNNDSYRRKLILAICFEAAYTILFVWKNGENISFYYADCLSIGRLIIRIAIISLIVAVPPLVTILTATLILNKKRSKGLIYALLAVGAFSQPIAISIFVYSDTFLGYFWYSVYSLLHFTGILLALSGVIEYERNNGAIK
ncbi:MAG: hypothetical protein ACI4KR_12700 [Ruminiclostridium sp.]